MLEPSNFCCPPAKPGVYLTEITRLHLEPPVFLHNRQGGDQPDRQERHCDHAPQQGFMKIVEKMHTPRSGLNRLG